MNLYTILYLGKTPRTHDEIALYPRSGESVHKEERDYPELDEKIIEDLESVGYEDVKILHFVTPPGSACPYNMVVETREQDFKAKLGQSCCKQW